MKKVKVNYNNQILDYSYIIDGSKIVICCCGNRYVIAAGGGRITEDFIHEKVLEAIRKSLLPACKGDKKLSGPK